MVSGDLIKGVLTAMRISIIGTGYVGLVTGVCLSSKGHHVICVDKKPVIIEKINSAISPIYEPGLDTLLKQAISARRLEAVDSIRYAVMNTDVSIIAVGTPFGQKCIDLNYIAGCAAEIGDALKAKETYHAVCVKSTVVPKTTDTFIRSVLENWSGKKAGDFGLAMNPEFLREGRAVYDFMNPDRIVIGAYDCKSFEAIRSIYTGIFDAPLIHVSIRTAEMIKYTSNALLALLISFSNEIASVCEASGGIDVMEVLSTVSMDKRFSPCIEGQPVYPEFLKYLKAGCGFGGSCFPKDVRALAAYAGSLHYSAKILKGILSVNTMQPVRTVNRIDEATGGVNGKTIAVLGLAFKPDTDDIRESPAIEIIKGLLEKGAFVKAADPIAVNNANNVLPADNTRLFYTMNALEALENADAAVLVTPWRKFLDIPAETYVSIMNNPIIYDGRRVLEKEIFKAKGVRYLGTGLPL